MEEQSIPVDLRLLDDTGTLVRHPQGACLTYREGGEEIIIGYAPDDFPHGLRLLGLIVLEIILLPLLGCSVIARREKENPDRWLYESLSSKTAHVITYNRKHCTITIGDAKRKNRKLIRLKTQAQLDQLITALEF